MEEDAKNILTPLLSRPQIQKQFELLDAAVNAAQKRIDTTAASDPETIRAIRVVERFLRRKRRVCYGGQAINSLLPPKRRFYDEKTDLPDYDFFTPDSREDSNELVEDLQKEGFTDVSKKVGTHEGTMKVLVNFVPVADCSEIHPQIFSVIQKRARSVNGILYTDPDFLRMMMYLELSRPRGQVERWKKVYERLMLLNHEYPVSECDEPIRTSGVTSPAERKIALEFCQLHKRVLVGPEIIGFLEKGQMHTTMEALVNKGGPVLFMSDKPKVDAEDIRDIIQNSLRYSGKLKIIEIFAKTDQLFNAVAVYQKREPLFLIFEESECHSYTTLRLEKGNEVRVGMPDLLLHLYYTLWLFGKKERAYFATGLDCLVKKLYHIAERSRNHPTSFLPAFGIRCSGRQRGIATLLKERAKRTEREKEQGKKSKTRRLRLMRSLRRSTRRT
jgi:hypothetical protein